MCHLVSAAVDIHTTMEKLLEIMLLFGLPRDYVGNVNELPSWVSCEGVTNQRG
jgi:hypothetical protein